MLLHYSGESVIFWEVWGYEFFYHTLLGSYSCYIIVFSSSKEIFYGLFSLEVNSSDIF